MPWTAVMSRARLNGDSHRSSEHHRPYRCSEFCLWSLRSQVLSPFCGHRSIRANHFFCWHPIAVRLLYACTTPGSVTKLSSRMGNGVACPANKFHITPQIHHPQPALAPPPSAPLPPASYTTQPKSPSNSPPQGFYPLARARSAGTSSSAPSPRSPDL